MTRREDELRSLVGDWLKAQTFAIWERSTSTALDLGALAEKAEARCEVLGIDFDDEFRTIIGGQRTLHYWCSECDRRDDNHPFNACPGGSWLSTEERVTQ